MPATDIDCVRAVLREWFPEALLDAPMEPHAEIRFGHSHRAGLDSLLRSVRPEIDDGVIAAVRTWGDVYEWFGNALIESGRSASPFAATTVARTALRPLQPSDIEGLYQSAMDPETGYRYRFRGKTVSIEEFRHSLYEGVLAQFVVVSVDGQPTPIGLVSAYNADLANGHAYIAMLRARPTRHVSRGAMMEGAARFVQYCFDTWPIRKIYMEVPEYNLTLIDTLMDARIAVEEGRLTDYLFHEGRFYDQVVASISRPTWQDRMSRWVSGLAAPVDSAARPAAGSQATSAEKNPR